MFILAAKELSAEEVTDYLRSEWTPTAYKRWWKGNKEIAAARSWADLCDIRLLDSHIVARGTRNIYNPVLGSGGNVGRRDFEKAAVECQRQLKDAQSEEWLKAALWGLADVTLPDLPSTGTWFVHANKAFNSGLASSREGQLSPWSYLLAMEGALLLSGGVNKRLGACARPFGAFPFVATSPAPTTPGELGSKTAEFWGPDWDTPASFREVVGLLRRGMAHVGNRAARAPFDFAAAALTAGAQAGVTGFHRFTLGKTTSANTYEAVHTGYIRARGQNGAADSAIEIANWVDRLPSDIESQQKSRFVGLKAPMERAFLKLAANPGDREQWWNLLRVAADVQMRMDRNRTLRDGSPALQRLSQDVFEQAWPGSLPEHIAVAKSIASVYFDRYSIFHNIYGVPPGSRWFGDERPASAVWTDGEPHRVLADVLERRLIDSSKLGKKNHFPPLRSRQICRPELVNSFLSGAVDPAEVFNAIPALALIAWREVQPGSDSDELPASPSPEFQLQALFRPLLTPNALSVLKSSEPIKPQTARARALVSLIRAGNWESAFDLAEQAYRAAGVQIIKPPSVHAEGDQIAAALLIPMSRMATRRAFRRVWVER